MKGVSWKALPCTTAFINKKTFAMKTHIIVIPIIVLSLFLSTKKLQAQLIDIKSWDGYYPEMDGTYPLSFIAFKGWLFPVPHTFVRVWPTYYYMELGALPVTDATAYSEETKTGLLRIAEKVLERLQMKDRHSETTEIKLNVMGRQEISAKIFNARTDEIPDIYDLANRFVNLYQRLSRFEQLGTAQGAARLLQGEADGLLMRFLMVNLMEGDHGQKLEAFSALKDELNKLGGEVDYTFRKVSYFTSMSGDMQAGYSFLTH